MHVDGRRPRVAVWRSAHADAHYSAVRRRIRNLMDRSRHAAARSVRAGAISTPDGQTRVSQPDHPGAGAVGGSFSDRLSRRQRHDRCAHPARADQRGVDWHTLVALPQTIYWWMSVSAWAGLVSSSPWAMLSDTARPSNVRAKILMANRMSSMAGIRRMIVVSPERH